MIISGANLGNVEVSYDKLSNYSWTDDARLNSIIGELERLYFSVENQTLGSAVHLMDIVDDKVVLKRGLINHRCSGDIENLRTISQYGILASEWFGELESEREGAFCAFVSRLKGKAFSCGFKGDLAEDDESRLNVGRGILLFIDDKNPMMEYLTHLDYFEFEHKKEHDKDYKESYSPVELAILEELIEPLSPCGCDMRKDHDFKTNYWSAIPGGIPSKLVNGICIKNKSYSDEELDEMGELFQSAVIFDGKGNVVRYPKCLTSPKNEKTLF